VRRLKGSEEKAGPRKVQLRMTSKGRMIRRNRGKEKGGKDSHVGERADSVSGSEEEIQGRAN
jgi:hypothetical protein